MSAGQVWLDTRRPPPPDPLAPWLQADADHAGEVPDALTGKACEALDRACSAPGPVRDSAFHLLAADALLTYACEAAVESSAPEGTLGRILRRVAAVSR